MRKTLIVFVLLLTGSCAMPTHIRPARTLEKGRFEHALSMGIGPLDPLGWGEPEKNIDRVKTPTFPLSYSLRYGAAERFELGAEIGSGFGRVEGTYQFLRSPFLDLAVGADLGFLPFPILEKTIFQREHVWKASVSVPMIAGLNVFQGVSLMGHGGPVYWNDVWMAQVGAGLDLRPFRSVSLRPFVSWMAPIPGTTRRFPLDQDSPYRTVGIDFALFGSRGYSGTGL